MRLGVLDHPLDLLLGQARALLDLDRVLLASALVLRGHVHDAVGVDVEGDLDLRHPTRCRRNPRELERAEQLVVRGDFTLTLEHLDLHRGLVVVSGGEGLRPLGRDGGVALDELGHHATLGLDAEGQRGDVEEQHVLDLALEDAGLQGGADGDDLVRVDPLVRFLSAGQLAHQIRHGGHTGGTTDEHDLVDVLDGDLRVLDHRLERGPGAVEEIGRDLLELAARQLLVEEQRVLVRVDSDVGQVDRRALRGGQFDLGLLRGLAETLQSHLVLGQIDAVLSLELVDEPLHDPVVPVVTTEVVVAGGGPDFDDALTDFEQRDVEGAATEVEDQDGLFLVALVQAVGQCGRGGLVDDAQDIETGDLAGFLRGLTLGVLEVRGDGDHRVGDVLTQIRFRVPLQFHQHPGTDLLRAVFLVVDRHMPVGADLPFHRAHRPVHVRHCLVLGGLADQHLTVLRECHHRRGRARTLRVGDHLRVAALEHAHHRVRGPQIDTHRASHDRLQHHTGWVWCFRRSFGITPTELECYRLNFPPGRNRGQGEELSVERSTLCVLLGVTAPPSRSPRRTSHRRPRRRSRPATPTSIGRAARTGFRRHRRARKSVSRVRRDAERCARLRRRQAEFRVSRRDPRRRRRQPGRRSRHPDSGRPRSRPRCTRRSRTRRCEVRRAARCRPPWRRPGRTRGSPGCGSWGSCSSPRATAVIADRLVGDGSNHALCARGRALLDS
ncbi:putative NAD-specific glutamate dehydrogenase [Rhodococcus opacus M213]|uniref:Putative NAD-specific glutamate dehydrogenase n=1 Tax=Rhodococcus opacus M213 TaxID=1129896 RepID=K8XC45_RHOOP|nr:putative NAD-specific glutamate dehydrogenase [Rhodococcus opacus M213]